MLYKSKNRTFNYKPRFSNENQVENSMVSSSKRDLIAKEKSFYQQGRKSKAALPISLLILFLVLLLICIYLLDSYIE